MGKRIITISREFGSGGRTIGKMVAERLGIPCYDKELVKKAALESGFSEAFVESQGEEATTSNSFLYALSQTLMSGLGSPISNNEYLYVLQHKLIRDLADEGPCVIVGRCADHILKDRKDCLHVFIHANDEFRMERIVTRYGERSESPQKRLADMDKKRKIYYQSTTGAKWGVCRNYHLALDSSVIGLEPCVDIIVDLVNKDREQDRGAL